MVQPLTSRHWPAASLDLVWVVMPVALIWFFVSVTPMPPNDLWWHMAAGRAMIDEQQIISDNRWAYSLPADTPYVYQSWLSEIIMYGAWQLGGVPLLAMLRLLAISGAYAIIGWHALRRAGGRAAALSLIVAALVGWSNWTLRPQTLALPVGAAFVALLSAYLDGRLRARWLAVLPLLMLAWVNLHGSFVLGLALVGAAWAGTLCDMLGPDPAQRPKRPALGPLSFAALATALACLANPLGLGIVGYLRTMLTNPPLQRLFVEWQPPRLSLDLISSGFWFYAMLLLLVVLMARGRARPSATDLLWYCGLAWLALGGVRYVMWFGLLLAPLLAQRIALLGRETERTPVRSGFSSLLLVLLSISMLATLPWLGPARALGLSQAAVDPPPSLERSLLDRTNPLDASAWLAANPIGGRFWTDLGYSSYTIWAIPNLQVFSDLRVELFPEPVWRDYFAIGRGDAASLALIERWQISHFMLSRDGQASLITLLTTTPGWCRPYEDEVTTIIARC